MHKSFKYLIPFAIFFALISFLWVGVEDPQDNPNTQTAPETSIEPSNNKETTKISRKAFELPTVMDPNKKVTQAIFKGQVTVLNSWASWCTACRREHELLLSLSKLPGVHWVGLNLGDNLKEAQRMLQFYGNPYHETIFDAKSQLAASFGLRGTPEFLILDKEGGIQYRYSGMINETIWQDELWPVIQSLQQN